MLISIFGRTSYAEMNTSLTVKYLNLDDHCSDLSRTKQLVSNLDEIVCMLVL
jgi:hypothetical protein